MWRFIQAMWWASVALMVLSTLTDILFLNGQVPAWMCLAWVAIAGMERVSGNIREAGR